MKYSWRLTPPLWAISEPQAHYAAMAARGWMLHKRGVRLDRFVRAEPHRLRFWLEFTGRRAGSDLFDEPDEIPEEKLQLYEDCGWKLVTERGSVHVFAAQDTPEVPQPYDIGDPAQDAMMLQLQKTYRNDILLLLITLPLLIAAFVASGLAPLHDVLTGWWWGMFWIFSLAGSVWVSLYGFFRMRRLRRQLRAGDWPGARRLRIYNGVRACLAVLSVLCLAVGIAELALSFRSSEPMPVQAEGVYLVPSETLGLPRTPAEESVMGRLNPEQTNVVDLGYALPFFTLYETQEVVDDDRLTIWQDVYVLHCPSLSPRLAQSLMEDGIFADAECYEAIDIPGLDGAWYVPGGMEYVAYKDEKVVYGIVNGGAEGNTYLVTLLEATAALWNR